MAFPPAGLPRARRGAGNITLWLIVVALVSLTGTVDAACYYRRWSCNAGRYYRPRYYCCNCQAGRYQSSNWTRSRACRTCPGGRYSRAGSSSCSTCPKGRYSPSGSSSCRYCSAGYYNPYTTQRLCRSCSGGYYSGKGATSCSSCPSGRYSTSKSSSCTNCPAGKYQPNIRYSYCFSCAPGYYQDSLGSTSCRACNAGYYQSSSSSTSCRVCPAGYFASGSARSSCQKTNAGYYATAGSVSQLACPAGRYGALAGSTSSVCDGPCAAGYYCDQPAQTSSQPTGKKCPAGRYGRAGMVSSNCEAPCPAGYQCPEGSGATSTSGYVGLLECGAGRTNPAAYYCKAGSQAPSAVRSGFYSIPLSSSQSRRTDELVCDAGYYCSNGQRYACPAGRYGGTVGLTSYQCSGTCQDGYYCPVASKSSRQDLCAPSGVTNPASYYCKAGIRYTCGSGHYTTPEGPDTRTRTGCVECTAGYDCPGDGTRVKQFRWDDEVCKSGGSKTVLADEGEGYKLFGPALKLVRNGMNASATYMLSSVKASGNSSAGIACTQSYSSSDAPFVVTTQFSSSGNAARLAIKQDEELVYSSCNAYTVVLQGTLVAGSSAVQDTCTFKVQIEKVNKAPFKKSAYGPLSTPVNLQVTRDSVGGTSFGSKLSPMFADPDGDELTFTIASVQPILHPFTIGACSGQFSVANSAILRDGTDSYSISVNVSDNNAEKPLFLLQTVNVQVTVPNRPPNVSSSPPEISLLEGTSDGTPLVSLLSSAFVSDPDGDSLTVRFRECDSATYCSAFSLDSSTGQLSVKDKNYLSYDTPGLVPRYVQVEYVDGNHPAVAAFFPVSVIELRERPKITTLAFSFLETVTGPALIGTLEATDQSGTDFTYQQVSSSDARIEVTSAGQVRASDGASFDWVGGDKSFECIVVANVTNPTDTMPGFKVSKQTTISLTVRHVNMPPTFSPPAQVLSVDENTPGERIANLANYFSDRDNNTLFYNYVSDPSSSSQLFTVDASSGVLSLLSSLSLNYEEQQAYNITVRVTDNGSPSQSTLARLTVNVNDVVEAAVISSQSLNLFVDENTSSSGGSFGRILVEDPDILMSPPATLAYSIESGSSQFTIDTSTGDLYVAPGFSINYEAMAAKFIEIDVKVSKTAEIFSQSTIKINVEDVPEDPYFVPPTQIFTLGSQASLGQVIGTLNFTDPDSNDELSISLANDDSGGLFEIFEDGRIAYFTNDSSTDLNSLIGTEYSLDVVVSDSTGRNATGAAQVTIIYQDAAPEWSPTIQFPLQIRIDEHTSGVASDIQLACSDSNVGDSVSFQIVAMNSTELDSLVLLDRSSGKFKVPNAGELDYETLGGVATNATVACVDTTGLRAVGTAFISINDVPEDPFFLDTTPVVIDIFENASVGTILYDNFVADDPDASSQGKLVFSLADADLPFELTTTQQIGDSVAKTGMRLKEPLDFYEKSQYASQLLVADETQRSASVSITVNVKHVNQPPRFSKDMYYAQVYENISALTIVFSDLQVIDRDQPETFSFHVLTPGFQEDSLFIFRGNSLVLASGKGLDYESKPQHVIQVQVVDSGGLSDTANLTISVLDTNDMVLTSFSGTNHDTTGTSEIIFYGQELGPKWKDVTIVAAVVSADGSFAATTSPCSRQATGPGTFNNTEVTCPVPVGVGQRLSWKLHVDSRHWVDLVGGLTSYEKPVIGSVASWPQAASTSGGDSFSVSGSGFGPAQLTGVTLESLPTRVSVDYGNDEFSYSAASCRVVDDTLILCRTSPGIGKNFEFKVTIGEKSSSSSQQSGWFADQATGYSPPRIDRAKLVVSSVPTEGAEDAVELFGTNFGPASEALSVSYSNGNYTFASSCKASTKNHTYARCAIVPGFGRAYRWTVSAGGQQSNQSPSDEAFSYDAPRMDSLTDSANRAAFNLDTEGGQVVLIRGANFGPAIAGIDPAIVATYGPTGAEYTAQRCAVVVSSQHNLLECLTVEGVGSSHTWRLSIAGIPAVNSLKNVSGYHPPVVATYSRPGSLKVGVNDLKTPGNETVELGGQYFGPPGTQVESATYGADNVTFVASACEVVTHTLMRCTTTEGAGSGHFWTVTIAGLKSIQSTTAYSAPSVTGFSGVDESVDVSNLHTAGGETVLIHGENFGLSSDGDFLERVTYGPSGTEMMAQECFVISHTRIRCNSVAGTGRNHRWIVSVAGQSSRPSSARTSYAPPVITAMAPVEAPTGYNIITKKMPSITINGTDLGASDALRTTSEVVVLIDNAGTLSRLERMGALGSLSTQAIVESLVQLQQQDSQAVWRNADAAGLPATALRDEWFPTLTSITLERNSKTSPSLRKESINFQLPEGFGTNRSVIVSVNGIWSMPTFLSYLPPRIKNISPSIPKFGSSQIEIVVDGENFCGGESCLEASCCGRVWLDGELVEVRDTGDTKYTHDQITFKVPNSDQERTLQVEVLDGSITEAVSFRRPAPAFSNLENDKAYTKPFSTQGGDLFSLYNVSGLYNISANQIEILIGGVKCSDVRVGQSRRVPDTVNGVWLVDLSCKTPPLVPTGTEGHDVVLRVNGLSTPAGSLRINYAAPTICKVDFASAGATVVLFADSSTNECSEQAEPTNLGRIPTTGGVVTVHGQNFGNGSHGFPLNHTRVSIESLEVANAQLISQIDSQLKIRIPPGAGGLSTSTASGSRSLSSSGGVNVEFWVGYEGNSVSFSYDYNPPTVTATSPTEIPTLPADTDTLTIIGRDFGPGASAGWTPDISVTVGGKACPVLKSNQTSIICGPPPEGQGDSHAVVVTVEGQISNADVLVSYALPRLLSISPPSAPTSALRADGSPIQIVLQGTNFGTSGGIEMLQSGNVKVRISTAVLNHTHALFSLPEGIGTLEVSLFVDGWQTGGGYSTNTIEFSYDPPSISAVARVSRDLSGTVDCSPFERCFYTADNVRCSEEIPDCFPTVGQVPIKLVGQNFGPPGTAVSVSVESVPCRIESAMASLQTHDTIICSLPEGTGANLSVAVGVGSAPPVSFASAFSYDPPRITSVMPNTPDAAGEVVVFRGANFGPGGKADVQISNLTCTDAVVISHSSLQCKIPADVVGSKEINVTVADQNVIFYEWQEILTTECKPGSSGVEGELCLDCASEVPGAVCPGGERSQDLIYSDMGWWRADLPTPDDQCHPQRQQRAQCPFFQPCEPSWACLQNNTCTEGYTGSRCSECVVGSYFRINGECKPCPDNAWLLGVFFAIAAVVATVVGYVVNSKNITLAAFTIGVDYLQVIAMFARTRVQWPPVVEETLQLMSFFNFNLELSAPECYLNPAPPYEVKWMVTMALPLGAGLMLAIMYLLHYLYKLCILKRSAKSRHTHVHALVATFIVIFYVLYLFLTRMTLDVFNCAPTNPPDGKQYMSGMTNIVCGETEVHTKLLVPLAIITLLFYVIAFPALSFLLLRKNKEIVKHDQILRAHGTGFDRASNPNYHFRRRFQRLYYLFKPGKWYWLMMILGRKFLIAFTALMFRSSPAYQLAMSLLVIFAAYALQVRHQPFMADMDKAEVVKDHMLKVKHGDRLHVRIQAAIDATRNRNSKKAGRSVKWDSQQQTLLAERQRRPVLVSERAIALLADYNTVESVLLACAVLVNLAGIMFLSGRFQGPLKDYYEDEYNTLGVLVLILIVSSVVYFGLVIIYEILAVASPTAALRLLSACSCGRRRTGLFETGKAGGRNATFSDSSTKSDIVTQANPFVARSFMQASGDGSSPVSDQLINMVNPPDQSHWPALREHMISLTESLKTTREELRRLKTVNQRRASGAVKMQAIEALQETAPPSKNKLKARKREFGQYHSFRPQGRNATRPAASPSSRDETPTSSVAAVPSSNSSDANNTHHQNPLSGSPARRPVIRRASLAGGSDK